MSEFRADLLISDPAHASSNGWPTPAAFRFEKQRRLEAEAPENPSPRFEAPPTRCCWPRFQFAPFVGRNLLRPFPSRHFDPFGTELL